MVKCNIYSYHKVGKYNGLTLLLDAETYDYMYQASLIDAYRYIENLHQFHILFCWKLPICVILPPHHTSFIALCGIFNNTMRDNIYLDCNCSLIFLKFYLLLFLPDYFFIRLWITLYATFSLKTTFLTLFNELVNFQNISSWFINTCCCIFAYFQTLISYIYV